MPELAPKITVLMTVFNGDSYLSEAIDSILAQTMPDFELIVVDDVSNDGSPSILESYAATDARVRVIRNAENSGPYPSANAGLAAARAPLIARLDADDICVPDRLARQLTFLEEHPDCLLVGGGYESIDAAGGQRFVRHNPMNFDTCAFVTRLRMPMVHPGFCFRARLPDGSPVRYDESFPISGDYALAAKLGSMGQIASLDGLLVKYRMHPENISSTKLNDQLHYGHLTASAAIARHYPSHIASDLAKLADVLYRRLTPNGESFKLASRGLDAALAYDSAENSIKERAAGILAEAFLKNLPMRKIIALAPALLRHGPHHMRPLAKRYARLKGWLPQLSG